MTTQNQSFNSENVEIVEPENQSTMNTQNSNQTPETVTTQNQSTMDLTQEQIQNLSSKFENHIQVQGDKIIDTLNGVELEITTDDANVYVTNAHGKSYKVEKRLLDSDEMKKRKARKLANKTTQLITHAITSDRWTEQIEANIESITKAMKAKASSLNLGSFEKVEHVEENRYIAHFEKGHANIELGNDSSATITSIFKAINESIDLE